MFGGDADENASEVTGYQLRGMALEAYNAGDMEAARQLLQVLADAGFELASTHCHLARIDLLQDDAASARNHAETAWENREAADPYILPRIHWLRLACACLDPALDDNTDRILANLREAVSLPGAVSEWTIAPVLEHIRTRLSEEQHALLAGLVVEISGTA
jgi:hypothetical protein